VPQHQDPVYSVPHNCGKKTNTYCGQYKFDDGFQNHPCYNDPDLENMRNHVYKHGANITDDRFFMTDEVKINGKNSAVLYNLNS
jgi:hypothetical protein